MPAQARDHIRNFCIIAHIDHGKSTLADRLLETTGSVQHRDMKEQLLDQLDLERERGITIKLAPVKLTYRNDAGEEYELNLIDTPGHVDFAYEVSRSLAACEGAILVVDAAQGVEAQTLANVYAAINHNLEIIPVINKIDLPAAEPEVVRQEIEEVIGLPGEDAILASAKEGIGIKEILDAVVERIPPPTGDVNAPLQALIFDSHFDAYRGVISYVRVVAGRLRQGSRVKLAATGKLHEVDEVGAFRPAMVQQRELVAGEVGYVIASIKDLRDARVGDTILDADHPVAALPGYKQALPMVYAGLYPQSSEDFQDLKEALEKLQLNDAALVYEPESSAALGFGF
ncbi:MAG: GTP-binding protein LepA, partial [Chloroflexota bacterium]|nr:GTP-binding protein LepA [Chloroflexota bacterium]